MTPYSTVIVEDEGPARRRLAKMVEQHPKLQLLDALRSGQEAIDRIPKLQPALLLLDIQLKDKTAFDVLEQIRDAIDSKVVFITAYDHYAIKAFEVEAIDYLLKPFDQPRFMAAINRVINRSREVMQQQLMQLLEQHSPSTKVQISIPEGSRNYLFQADDIRYIQADGYYVKIVGPASEKLIRISLKKLDNILPSSFLRLNKSIMVNTAYISRVDYLKHTSKIILKDGSEFLSTKVYNQQVKEKLKLLC